MQEGLIELVQIYGEIDRRIKLRPELASRVSSLLPVYERAYAGPVGSDVHWFDQFEAWMQDIVTDGGGERSTALPGLEGSIERLAGLDPRCRMLARRLHAAGAAAQVLRDQDDQQILAMALGPTALEGIGDLGAAAKEFVDVLRSDPEDTGGGITSLQVWWDRVTSWGPLEGRDQVGPPPCSGGLVWVDVEGEAEPVATLETVFESDLPFEAAQKFCDPLKWRCFAFWCDMKALGTKKGALKATDGVREFREFVSLDCANEPSRLAVDLMFKRTDEPDPPQPPRVSTTEYELAREHPHIAVNEGTLEVVELLDGPSKVMVRSTKRLKFKGSFDGPAFAMVMCLVGYLSYVEDLLCCAADPEWKKAFPGTVPDKSPDQALRDADPYFAGLTKYTIERVAAALEDCLDGYSKPAEPAPGTPGKKPSSAAGTPVQTMADMYARMLREGARVADMGLRGVTGAPASGRRSGAGAARSAAGEVVEDWAQLGRLLVKKWSAHASQIATKLDAPQAYKADTMAADLATTASLAIETGARLTWETLDSATILSGGRGGPHIVESGEFSIAAAADAELKLVGDLKSGLGHTLPEWAVLIEVIQPTGQEVRFKLRAIAALCRAGTYRGEVWAPAATGVAPVKVRIVVP